MHSPRPLQFGDAQSASGHLSAAPAPAAPRVVPPRRWRAVLALCAAAVVAASLCGACGNSTPTVTVPKGSPAQFFIANGCSYAADTSQASGLIQICDGFVPVTIEGVPFSLGLQTDAGAVSPAIPVQAPNITTPITFQLSGSNPLPPGLKLDGQTGVISGIPTQTGSFPFSVIAVDSTTPTPQTTLPATFTINVAAPAASLTVVGQNNLGGTGENAGITVFKNYAYIGNRGDSGVCQSNSVKVVNLADPANPRVVATIPNPSGASYQPTGAVATVNTPSFSGDLLALAIAPCNPATDTSAADTGVALYNVTNPASPAFLGSWSARAYGGGQGVSSVAVLPESNAAYVLAAVPEAEASGSGFGDLEVLNVTNPAAPAAIGNWGAGKALGINLADVKVGQDQRVFLSSISLSADGTQAYLAYWDEGVVILNVSNPAAISDANSAIVLNHTVYPTIYGTSKTIAYSAPEGNTYQVIPVDNGTGMMISDLVCASQKVSNGNGGTTSLNPYTSSVCGTDVDLTPYTGWGFVRTYTLSGAGTAQFSAQPAGSAVLSTGESDPAPAAGSIFPGDGIYSPHAIAWNGNPQNPRGYVAWFSNGLVDLDLTSLSTPSVLAAFVPPATAGTPGDTPDAPLVYGVAPFTLGGQQYIALTDINSGLWIVQETGAPQFAISTTSLPNGTVGVKYSATLNAINGTGDVSFGSVGTLPPGLTLSAGVLSGTPTTAGATTFAIQATDSAGQSVTQQYTVTINTNLTITTQSLPEATTNESYSQTLTEANGTAPFTWAVASGSLPAGMTLDATSGVISGTPASNGVSTFTISVTDSAQPAASDSASFTLTVAPLTISTASLANGALGTSYTQAIAMANGTAPFTFKVTSGALPAGLALSTTGQITGTPTATGASTFTVTVTDADSQTASQAYTLTVGGMAITTTSLPNGTVGTGYLQAIAVANGTAPYTFALASGSAALPAGLTLSAEDSSGKPGASSGSTGVISGVPTAAGAYTFTVQATDKNGIQATQTYTVTISQ